MTAKRTHIVVIGGGYAGTLAANHLRHARRCRHHPGQPAAEVRRAHPAAPAGRRHRNAAVDYGTLLGEGVRLVVDNADRIDTAARTIDAGFRRRAGLRLPDLCGRQHRRRSDRGARRRRIRLSHRRIRAGRAAAWRSRRAASRRADHRRRRRVDRHRDRLRTWPSRGGACTLVCGGLLGPTLSQPGRRSVAKWLSRLGVDAAGDGEGRRGVPRRGGAGRRRGAAQRADHLDGGLRRAGLWPPAAGCPPTRWAGCSPTRH